MNKKILLLGIISLVICLLIIADTYALFETNASADIEMDIGKWVINVNGQDAAVHETITLDDFVYSNSSHTEDDYFAPGGSAQFDLEIDASLSDVSVAYSIDIDDSELLAHPNIYFTIRDINDVSGTTATSYDGVIYLSDANRVKTIRITLVWNDNSSYDDLDTSLVGDDLSFDIAANFQQYLGE